MAHQGGGHERPPRCCPSGLDEEGAMRETKAELLSKAWCKRGLRKLNLPWEAGLLMATEGRVCSIKKSEPLFQADKQDVKAELPWWLFGGGVYLSVDGQVYCFYFTKPRGASNVDWSNVVSMDTIPLEFRELAPSQTSRKIME